MSLRLYNTMGRKIEDFVPIKAGEVGFYGCGPTVYNYAHIGNLRAYIFLDILDRTLDFLGYKVNHVMNITDIGHLSGDADDGEDKMVKTAKERGQSVLEIAQFYTDAFFKDIDALNIRRPTVVCKATDHVEEMIALIKKLEENGHTYMAGGNLYFDVSTFADYGKLAKLNLDDLKAGARIAVDENKRNPYDFVLWFTKSKFENQALVWDSPWGKGYPGWHIECSAMSMKYLGEHIDIHTGGIDHIPIHHTNEIAQSEGATGKKWVNYWLHNEFLVIDKKKSEEDDGGKMSKSSGNFLTLTTLIERGYNALDYRFFLLGAHYRSQVAFSWDAMDSAKNARKALVQRVVKVLASCDMSSVNLDMPLCEDAQAILHKFTTALEDDLATPRALSELQVAVKSKTIPAEQVIVLIQKFDEVLGLRLLETAESIQSQNQAGETSSATAAQSSSEDVAIQAEVDRRIEAKKNKDYALADSIRNSLKEKGVILEDTANGTTWKYE